MQLSDSRLTEAVIELLQRLQARADLPGDITYDLGIAAATLAHVAQADRSDGDAVRDYARRSAILNQQLVDALPETEQQARAFLTSAVQVATRLADASDTGASAKAALSNLLAVIETAYVDATAAAPDALARVLASFAPAMLGLHLTLPLFGDPLPDSETKNVAITRENLTAYVKHALSDDTAQADNLIALPGGFGKETILFAVKSRTLNADLVMRRDTVVDALDGLDCHAAPKEFPVLKAVHARGFPAPEPLFFENATLLIPGPPFSIMRRAPGKVAGNAMGGSEPVPAALQATLAQVVARLHNVAQMPELSGNPMFEASLWGQSAQETTHRYIATWRRQFIASKHSSAPSLHGLFEWLLAHVPTTDAPSTLIHGDIGFHNLLFDDGALTAVLDWEFSHVGDPAEDLGYIRSVMGGSLDWSQFLAAYATAGRPMPDEQRVRFFEIWSHARNAAASVMITGHFETREFRDVKLAMLALRYVPHFVARAHALIVQYDADFPLAD